MALAVKANGGKTRASEVRETRKFVCFLMDDQVFAADVRQVHEAIPFRDITRVFQTPPFVLGVVNLRGNIVAVIDIRLFFGLPASRPRPESRLVVLHAEQTTCGILVDALAKVRDIEIGAIAPPPPTVGGITADYVTGVVQQDGRPVVILDVAAIMNSEQIRNLRQ
jgi:purine-binding chemotaxis protein CheW